MAKKKEGIIAHLWKDVISGVVKKDSKPSPHPQSSRLFPPEFINPKAEKFRSPGKDQFYLLGEGYEDVYLTWKEIIALWYLMHEAKIASVAEQIGVSDRTVEYYVKNLRSKMRCATRKELIKLISRTEFIKNVKQCVF